MKAAIIINIITLFLLLELNAVAPNLQSGCKVLVRVIIEPHALRIAKRCGVPKWNYRNKIIYGKKIEKIINNFKHLKNNGKNTD